MDRIIQIQCPKDGAILSVKEQPGLERGRVTCPVCKQSRPFAEYKKYVPGGRTTGGDTQYPSGAAGSQPTADGHTQMGAATLVLGRLVVVRTGQTFQLRPGRNVVGRKAASSEADFQIDTGANRRMSRSHVVVDVSRTPTGYVHQVKLCKEQTNATYVGHARLEAGDCVVLSHGDVLRLPDEDVRFELPDGEATDV